MVMKEDYLTGKIVIISGGCGSLGQALTKELLSYHPQSIRIFDNSEYAHWQMQQHFNDSRLRYFIGDVRDKNRLQRAMTNVDIVIHAAALKHIPLCEYNPIEAIKTNIEGSINVIDAAIDCHVDKVLGVSTDKAVHPINLYGATKLVMEKLFVQSNVYGDTKVSCVRSGNFEGSSGSVLSLIAQQVEKGEEITLTDKEMTRFWITLDNASKFIIRCLDMMTGGEIFIPKMPERQVSDIIQELAPDAKTRIIGKRPGEKLHELLFNEDETPLSYDDYYVIRNDAIRG